MDLSDVSIIAGKKIEMCLKFFYSISFLNPLFIISSSASLLFY